MQVDRIFTVNSISPSLFLRQYPDRYAFRAGRNLPDKEFRYLRTVIVTAAVHRGLSHKLCKNAYKFPSPSGTGQASAPIHSFSTLRRPVLLISSRLDLITATLTLIRAPFLPKLQGHFAEFLKKGYLALLSILYPPTCVSLRYRYILVNEINRAFLGNMM